MARDIVMVKSFPNGINVILDPEVPFNDLYVAFAQRFRDSAKFFGNAKKVFSFEGRDLSDLEERALVEAVGEYSNITVLCVVKKDEELNQIYYDASHCFSTADADNGGKVYKGSVHSGQVIETSSSIVILGDVNHGAIVKSAGSVVVLGCIYGDVYGGANGDKESFVAALDIKASEITVCDEVCKIIPRMGGLFNSKPGARICYIGKNGIEVSMIDKGFLTELPF